MGHHGGVAIGAFGVSVETHEAMRCHEACETCAMCRHRTLDDDGSNADGDGGDNVKTRQRDDGDEVL
eukprot:5898147-Pyramimonas_sp.AAC.1